jgi:hypothetical protein
MKNVIFTLLIVIEGIRSTNAQEISDNAIGIRLGDGDSFGTEISYQRALSDTNRIEIDLGFENGDDSDRFKAVGVYQWVRNIDGGFNGYAATGAGLGTAHLDDDFVRRNNISETSETFLFIAGQIGLEYNFEVPLLLSLDIRPERNFGNIRDGIEMYTQNT